MVATATEIDAAVRSARLAPARAESEWLRPLDFWRSPKDSRGPEGGISRKAAVLGANMWGLLATLVLRLQNLEVVTLGDAFQPLLTACRVQGLPGWSHGSMSPALGRIQLVEEDRRALERT